MTQKQVAVIGGGIAGVCTAYFLAEAGHDVVVIERHHNVAEEASHTNPGLVAPAYSGPSAAPGMPRKILSSLFKSESAVSFKPSADRALWRWISRWLDECDLERFRINKLRMQRLATYSRDILQLMSRHYEIDYEQTRGVLQLFRSAKDLKLAEPALSLLAEYDVPFLMLDAKGAQAVEPMLSTHTPLDSAVYFPEDEAGNCPLFAKRLKTVCTSMGVQFHFTSAVEALEPEAGGVGLRIGGNRFNADAVVIAAGADSMRLLKPFGVQLPVYPVKSYVATANIKNFDHAPVATIIDEAYSVTLARMGGRIRIAGIPEFGTRTEELQDRALRTLARVGSDWFPHAAIYGKASFWSGALPTLPDGPPLLGTTPARNVYINIGHGSGGWTMAAGAGKVLADLVSGSAPDIDLDGLTLARYG
ncbi:D-amino acid dehydrogenase [Noviherbaspirillum sp. CPCC 100848]|uniref:D-amino acid dehydrogenase n=1 Tax=Noviherbaspirillum album TaxID=3080276 RepID=A0ABU6JDV7_9BURK|nr:D-amino acid dehydrogenase [Noviherbaspirillum sp. CPCC 100848]MEC4721841.1 D-amino acid dehydrogenase [Noviherbaspirillum sp. CPCC 100848]